MAIDDEQPYAGYDYWWQTDYARAMWRYVPAKYALNLHYVYIKCLLN